MNVIHWLQFPIGSDWVYAPIMSNDCPNSRFFLIRTKTMTTVLQRFNEAEKLKDQGKLVEAATVLNEILAEEPDHVLAHLTLARICTQTGQHEEAVKHAERACELEPTDSTNFTVLSVTYQRAWAGTQDQRYIQLAEEAMARSRMIGH